jgi:hypothetical protein
MRRLLLLAAVCATGISVCTAQSLDDLNIQIHGYATQGFIYTNHNNWNSMQTGDGSPAWTEAVFNVTSQPTPKLRVGAQLRYFMMGSIYGNAITLDWASADYKVNDKLGFRFGKVKTPNGLFNDIQDVDPAYIWSLLPQSMYPITSRTSILAHYGAVVYGKLPMGSKIGKLEYQIYYGERVLPAGDGFFVSIRESGANMPNGLSGPTSGGTLRWHTPVNGLMLGVAWDRENMTGAFEVPGVFTGKNIDSPFKIPFFFGKYEHDRFMFASEYSRVPANHKTVVTSDIIPQAPPVGAVLENEIDHRQWYAMSSYRLTNKLNAGAYYSSYFDLKAPFATAWDPANHPDFSISRYQKDWDLSARYDFTPNLYLKGEQHFIDGTNLGYLYDDNDSLQPTSRMTILKVGVNF